MTIQTIENGVTLYVFRTTVNANFAELSTLVAGKYAKPSTGIPATDLAAAVQTSLGKADTALQVAPVVSVAGRTGAVTLSINDISGAVKTVNNTAPDANGNVNISVSAGSVASTGITDSTTAGRALLIAADVAAQRTALGLGTAATQASTAFATAAQGVKADAAQPKTTVTAGTALGATRTTTDADDGGTFTAAVAGAVTIHSGAVANFGFGVSGAGAVTFAGASGVTVTDKRSAGSANPVCSLVQVGANAYEVWGTKA